MAVICHLQSSSVNFIRFHLPSLAFSRLHLFIRLQSSSAVLVFKTFQLLSNRASSNKSNHFFPSTTITRCQRWGHTQITALNWLLCFYCLSFLLAALSPENSSPSSLEEFYQLSTHRHKRPLTFALRFSPPPSGETELESILT